DAKEGDKVICSICSRGMRHSEHRAEVVATFGDAQTAVNCAEAVLTLNQITMDFPEYVKSEAEYIDKRGIKKEDFEGRLDLRDEIIFTIDSADTKDIDDAISLKKENDTYHLSVHIADVSHYVTAKSKIDDEAFERGTSIYFADRVVPMLPKQLSNGICSLNPQEDRLAFSCIMTVSKEGKLLTHKFKKTIIRSTVKGVYKEINQILNHNESEEIANKYKQERETLFLMKELCDILSRNKKNRGAPDIETSESYIILDENSKAVDVVARTRGESEVMIEEFMLMANEAAATVAKANQIPFVYRVHEPPSEEKIERLHKALEMLGLPCKEVQFGMPTKVLANLITDAKDKPYFPVINMLVLRSMSKAKYHEVPVGHYGLCLENYAQFTSPIRRYPDLTIHRILTDMVGGMANGKLKEKYTKFAADSARHSTEKELASMRLERDCDDCYKAEYIKTHIGENFNGIISGVAFHGIYVQLENTVEGLVRADTLPEDEFEFDEMFEFKNLKGGKSYRVGDSVKIKVIGADVSAGKIDFLFSE
ncbi:MAG: VacB/RNase II family 3'-5' exoribonuclease, partial [Oscillospiraceae bacterium]